LPNATPTSIAPPSPDRPGKQSSLWRAAQIALAAIVLVFVVRALVGNWRDFQKQSLHVHLMWGYIAASGVVVLGTYALLIEVWRRILAAWSARISFADATRIWCVSNLGKYVPGKVWQIAAMGKLAHDIQVPAAAAAGSAVLNTVVNIGIGFAVGVVAGFRALDRMSGGYGTIGVAITVVIICGVLLLPTLLPRITAIGERVRGKSLDLGTLPPRAVYIAIVGNIAAWILYGWSFQLLVHGVLGHTSGTLSNYVAAYALSYVMGYLVFVVPGGIGVREGVQTTALTVMQLATAPEALLVSVSSRLWLTVLEVIPGLLYLARGIRPRPDATSRDGTIR
jgi:hypothetical protein